MTGVENALVEPASIVVTQYETLRSAALGEVLPVEARSGLTLFLRRGMWGWAMGTTGAAPQPTRPPLSNRMAPKGYRTVIHIFAAMATHADNRGATP